MKERILAIGTHPDDVELGCAGLLQQSDQRQIILMSLGGQGGVKFTRYDEALAASHALDASFQAYDGEDTKLTLNELLPTIEMWIKDFEPTLILTASKHDTHQDHLITYHATKIATREYHGTVLSYFGPSCAKEFKPNIFVDLTNKHMLAKIAALKCHKSQSHRQYTSHEYVRGMARYWAMATRSKSEYVEPYELVNGWL